MGYAHTLSGAYRDDRALGDDVGGYGGIQIPIYARMGEALLDGYHNVRHRSSLLLALDRFGVFGNILLLLQERYQPIHYGMVIFDAYIPGGSTLRNDNFSGGIQRGGVGAYTRTDTALRDATVCIQRYGDAAVLVVDILPAYCDGNSHIDHHLS